MPTKPATTFTLATNTNYSVGPFAGSACKVAPADVPNGLTPGQGVQSEALNYCLHWTGEWITDWLSLGSSAAGIDAHIVETDSTGEAKLSSARLGATAAAQRALYVDANSGALSTAVELVNTFGGYCLLATVTGASAAVRAVGSGSGAAVQAVSLGSGSAVTGSASGAASTISVSHSGAAQALLATATGTAPAIGALGSNTSAVEAIYGEARHGNAYGGHFKSDSAGSTTGVGARCEGRSSATGLIAVAADGYGAIVQSDTTAPSRSPLRVVPQNADPITASEGDQTYSSTLDQPRMYADGRWQAPWVTTKGHAHGVANVIAGPVNNTDAATYTDIVTCTVAAPNDPKTAGVVLVYAAADFGDEVGATFHETIDVRIYDITAAAVVWSATIANIDRGVSTANLCPRGWSVIVPYSAPTAGPREFRLQFKRTTDVDPTDGVVARNGCLDVLGVFGV